MAPRPQPSAESAGIGASRQIAIALLAAVAMLLSIYLAWTAFTGGSVAGCGGGEAVDCEQVLATRWAKWLGMPVGAAAAAVYASILAASGFLGGRVPQRVRRLAFVAVLAFSALAAAAGLWFVGLQAFAVGKFCTACLATHACGVALAAVAWWPGGTLAGSAAHLPAAAVAVAALAALVLGQLALAPVGYQITRADELPAPTPAPQAAESAAPAATETSTNEASAAPSEASEPAAPVTARKVKLSRPLRLVGSAKTLDAYEHPIIGSPDAEHILVKMFDYTCHHCRARHFQLEAARDEFGERLAVVVLPVPMNRACNRFGPPVKDGPHAKSCVYARLALAVWREDRTKFSEFHDWLFAPETPPSPEEANAYAKKLLGAPEFRAAYDDWRLSEQLGIYTGLYGELGRGPIPKLIDDRIKLEGDFSSADELIGVLKKEWGAP